MGSSSSKAEGYSLNSASMSLIDKTGDFNHLRVVKKGSYIYMIRTKDMSIARVKWRYENRIYKLEVSSFHSYGSSLFYKWEKDFFPTDDLILTKDKLNTLKGIVVVCYLSISGDLLFVENMNSNIAFKESHSTKLYHFDNNFNVMRSS